MSRRVVPAFGPGDTNKHTFVLNTANATCAVDSDVRILNVGNLSASEEYNPIFINDIGGDASNNRKGSIKIYNFNVISDGEVVMNLVPARNNTNNSVGMYDLVTGAFFTNAGTGIFGSGEELWGIGDYGECEDVGTRFWAPARIVNAGSLSERNECPSGLTTVGYGHGADEESDCGYRMHWGPGVFYAKSSSPTSPRPSSPALNIQTSSGDIFYIPASTSNHSVSPAHLGDGTNQWTLYDDGLLYGERNFTTGERITE